MSTQGASAGSSTTYRIAKELSTTSYSRAAVPPPRDLSEMTMPHEATSTADLSEVVMEIMSKRIKQSPILTFTTSEAESD